MDASPCCWICLGDEADYRGRLPEVICGCSTRPAHATCMSRWRLQRAGTFEEKICSSCLQDHKTAWYDHLIDDDLMTSPINPVMAVVFKGTTRMIKVKLGPEGKVKFERTVKDQFGIPQYLAFDVVFDVKAPGEDTGEGGQGLTLKGIGAFDAAVRCAKATAASRALLCVPYFRPVRCYAAILKSTFGTLLDLQKAEKRNCASNLCPTWCLIILLGGLSLGLFRGTPRSAY